jgi:hypothetical protein
MNYDLGVSVFIFKESWSDLGFKKRVARRCNKGQKAEANVRASRTRDDNFLKKYLNYIWCTKHINNIFIPHLMSKDTMHVHSS